jgi:hypothetical protein
VPNSVSSGVAYRRKFFRCELEQVIDVDSLLEEAYILVNKGLFSYADVKGMTRSERSAFLRLLKEDIERQNDAIKRT